MKSIDWIGSSHDDLSRFPKTIRGAMGYALYLAQTGIKHPHMKTLSGMNPWVKKRNSQVLEMYLLI